jgi:hypothetical protein
MATIEVESWRYEGWWVITPRSYLTDRFDPQHEFIYMPPGIVPGGALRIQISEGAVASNRGAGKGGRLARIKQRLRPLTPVDLGLGAFCDLRHEQFANWSHHLNQHLPLALRARHELGADLTIVLPAQMKRYIVALYRQFGFPVLTTDALVRGRLVSRDLDKGASFRALRPALIEGIPLSFADAPAGAERLYVARKDSRRISNEAEIALLLESYGYRTVYLEDHAPADQIAMVRAARHIVAIHGAALAPLMFHEGGDRLSLIEILPVGHVTKFYRVMCSQIGGRYIAVRGRAKPAHVPDIYAMAKPFTRYSLEDFEVDPAALEQALRLHHDDVPLFDSSGLAPPA